MKEIKAIQSQEKEAPLVCPIKSEIELKDTGKEIQA